MQFSLKAWLVCTIFCWVQGIILCPALDDYPLPLNAEYFNQDNLERAVQLGEADWVREQLDRVGGPEQIHALRLVHMAAQWGHAEVVALLVARSGDMAQRNGVGLSPLELAVEAGHVEVVALLIVLGVGLFEGGHAGGDVVHLATQLQHPRVWALLQIGRWFQREAQGNWNAHDPRGLTFAHHLAQGGYVAAMQALLDWGGNVNTPTGPDRAMRGIEYRWTPLHYAAAGGHRGVVRLLLNRGADVDAQDYLGWTPLHFAAMFGNTIVICELLRFGANRNVLTHGGETPLGVARRFNRQPRVLELLRVQRPSEDPRSELRESVMDGAPSRATVTIEPDPQGLRESGLQEQNRTRDDGSAAESVEPDVIAAAVNLLLRDSPPCGR